MPPRHKWHHILPALRLARDALGLNKSRLDLLEKLLACLPGDTVCTDANGQLIVFASNLRLAEMTHRSNDKAITRLITELQSRGLLQRRSSPNGKRYTRQGPDGQQVAYGLDLGPLLARMPEIDALAEAEAIRTETCRRLREDCSLMLKRLSDMPDLTDSHREVLEDGRRQLRRKPEESALRTLYRTLSRLIPAEIPDVTPAQPVADITDGTLSPVDAAPVRPQHKPVRRTTPAPQKTDKIGGCAPQNACHKDTSPIPIEKTASSNLQDCGRQHRDDPDNHRPVALTPSLVERAMPRVANLGRQIRGSLRDLVDGLLACLGISPGLWQKSLEKNGFEESALMLMVIYERQRDVRHPPGYFAKLLKDDRHLVTGGAAMGPGSRLVSAMVSV